LEQERLDAEAKAQKQREDLELQMAIFACFFLGVCHR
jgi:hypothetical protein